MRRAPVIASSSLADVLLAALEQCDRACLDDPCDRAVVASMLENALLARPEAVALRAAWAGSPTQATLIIAQRECGGDREGSLLGAAARLAGLEVTR